MEKFFSLIMYILWIATVIAILSTTFTNFQYEDLNILAIVLLVFAGLNSFFMINRNKK